MALSTPPVRRRPRIFHGWYMLAVIVAAGMLAGPTSQAFFGIMVGPITTDLGWDATAVAGAVTFGGIASGITVPFIGHLADRFGPRVLMAAGAVLMATSFFVIASVGEVWHLFLGYGLARGISQNLVAGVVARTAVVNWFRRMRGRAIGLTHTAHPLGSVFLAPAALLIMDLGFSWRVAWIVFGLAMLLLVVPVIAIMRRTPEEMGLLPDGDTSPDTADAGHAHHGRRGAADSERSWTLTEAARTPTLWLMIGAMLLGGWGGGGLPFHMPVYYTNLGFAAAVGVAAITGFSIAGAFANTMWGFLAERYSERMLAVLTMLLGALLAVAFHFIAHPVAAVAMGVVLGIAVRGEGSLMMILIAQYFGRSSYGAISGVASQATFIGLGLGPVTMALIEDRTGSYTAVFLTATVTFIAAAILLLLLRKPTPAAGSISPSP